MSDASLMQMECARIAETIIAEYLEHYDFPWQGESHMHDCITSELELLMSRNAFNRCAEEYNEREERMDIIRDRLKKEKAKTKAELEGDITHYKLVSELQRENQEHAEAALLQAIKEHDIILAGHKSRIFSTEKRAEKAEAENAALKLNLPDALWIAKFFHDIYENLAPQYGYETRLETREFDSASPNGKLMVAACGELRQMLMDLGRKP